MIESNLNTKLKLGPEFQLLRDFEKTYYTLLHNKLKFISQSPLSNSYVMSVIYHTHLSLQININGLQNIVLQPWFNLNTTLSTSFCNFNHFIPKSKCYNFFANLEKLQNKVLFKTYFCYFLIFKDWWEHIHQISRIILKQLLREIGFSKMP